MAWDLLQGFLFSLLLDLRLFCGRLLGRWLGFFVTGLLREILLAFSTNFTPKKLVCTLGLKHSWIDLHFLQQLVIVILQLDGQSIVIGFLGVKLVAVEEYLIDIGMELGHMLVPAEIDFLLDGAQVHGLLHHLQVVGHALVYGVHWLPEWP